MPNAATLESALRVLLQHRNIHSPLMRLTTRATIHHTIAVLRSQH